MKRNLILGIALTMLLGLVSCSKNDDAHDLLSTVPGSAQVVTVVNINKLIHDIDAKADGNELQLNDQLKKLTATSGTNPLDLLTKGCIRLTNVVVFVEQNKPYVTGFVGDEKAFKDMFEKEFGDSFTYQGKMQVCRNVAIYQDRFWIVSEVENIDNISHYMTISEKSSMASRGIADKLMKSDEDITGVASMASLTSLAGNMYMSLSEMMTGQAEFLYFEVQFDKGKIELEALMLDSKYKPLKEGDSGLQKINMGTIDMLEGDMDYLMAIGLNKKIMQTVAKQMPVTVPGIEGVEGTVAIAGSQQMQGSGLPTAMAVIKTENAQVATQLGDFVKEQLRTNVKVSVKGKTLLLRTAELSGKINVGPHLSDLKGAYFGVVVSPNALKNIMPGKNIPFDGASLIIKPDDGTFKIQFSAYTGSNANALATLLEIAEQAMH